ncbi:MAG: Uma2 family endonuclease [Chloroflexota bacterium]|nr:Uma2 family endonuclease [Chloroflexota bacterium]
MVLAIETPTMQLRLAGDLTDIDLEALQGMWSDAQYLRLTADTLRLIEFTDGVLEVLPMPTRKHQAISQWLFLALLAVIQPGGGKVFYSPLRLQIRPGKYREPDLLALLESSDPRNRNAFWLGADLVVEIVSPDNPLRDTQVKRLDYAEGGIAEYWIVNPLDDSITVLQLVGTAYREHGVFRRGEQATSALLPGFAVPVAAVLDAE